MATTTVGQVLLKFFIPAQFHNLVHDTVLDKKGIGKLFAELAEKLPDQYSKIVSDLTRLGFEIATRQGTSITLKDLVSPVDKHKLWDAFDVFSAGVEKTKDSKAIKDKKIFEHYNDMMSGIEKDILAKGLADNRSLAKIILAGSRGTPAQYRGTITTQGFVVDAEGKPKMDIPIKSSYAEGLTLPEYLTTSFGTRTGEVLKKISVAQGGYGCLEENTLVLMGDYTEKPIKDIAVGDIVMGADLSGLSFPVRVSAKFDNGVQDVYEYVFRKGKQRDGFISIKATDQHKVLAKTSGKGNYTKRRLAHAKKHFSLHPSKGVSIPENNVELFPLLAGLFIGDGNLTDSTHLSLCSSDPEMIAYFNKILSSHNLQFKKARSRAQDYEYYLTEMQRSVRERDNAGRILKGKIYNKASLYFDAIGIRGMKSYEKTLPRLNELEMASLLGGLFEADGCVSSSNNSTVPVVGFKSTSYKLICSVASTLEKMFGIYPGKIQTIKAENIKPSKINLRGNIIDVIARRDAYTFVINDQASVLRFASTCFMPGVKGQKLRKFITAVDKDARYDAYAYHFNRSTYLGKTQVWDIEVDHPDHLFLLANGAIVSNSKQFARALMPLQVVEADCETVNGIDILVSDRESVGAFLAKGVEGHNRNNEVTSKMLGDLKSKGVTRITIRSPMTCQSNKKHHSGGLCQMCVGRREKGMAAMDSYVGLVAGTAVAEPLTESAMKARHSGGAATSLGGQQGFKLINQLANIPKTFIGKAPLAQEDGIITKLEPAAAGGYFISVNDHEHYIGLDQETKFKLGDRVEQGEVLSSGLIDPGEVVQYRGIGDGRKYYMEAMKKAFDDSGLPVNRRNFELIAKAAIDHVRVTDPEGLGDYLPDQVVAYSAIEKDYEARQDSKELRLDIAYGKYLEKPELHYTIGTKVTSAVIKHLREHKIESVLANDNPPHFEPAMVRLVDVPEHHDDWMHVLNSTNLAKRFVNLVNRGATSDTKGASPIPGLAYGVGFGQKG